jgi:hypothetical protein
LLPGHMRPDLPRCRLLPCVVCQCYAVLCGQNEAIGDAALTPAPTPGCSNPVIQRWSREQQGNPGVIEIDNDKQ